MTWKILVVDDEAIPRDTLSEILSLEGYQVLAVSSGEEALSAIHESDYDLVVLDIMMPGMSGMEVVQKLAESAPGLQIIMLTAHGSIESAIDALRYRVHDYIMKPASPKAILASVKKALERREELLLKAGVNEAQAKFTPQSINQSSRPIDSRITFDVEQRIVSGGGLNVYLTPTEARLLSVFLDHPDRVLTHQEIIKLVEGYDISVQEAPALLRPIVSRLRQKLAAYPATVHWIKNIRGTGYLFSSKSK
jgi:DNA-binding response OmpR family regulator